jgi:predicted acyltransferase
MTSPDPRVSDIPQSSPRLLSLDALRGFDMFWILGADDSIYALHTVSQGGIMGFLAYQLDHADWVGFRFYDLIFPLFVFLMGVSIVFSIPKAIEREGVWGAYKRILRRFVLMFLLALIYSGGVSQSWPDLRLMGVLNRIALCYLATALLFVHFRWKTLLGICAALLVGYWGVMSFVPFPDLRPRTAEGELVSVQLTATNVTQLNWASTNMVRGVFDQGVNLANYLDQKYLPGRKWDYTWDPEGLLSTFPAIATCLLGVFAGLLVRSRSIPEQQKVFWLLGAGVAAAAAGWLWHLNFPVIKKIWTSSYVLVAGGYSAMLLAVFYQVIELWQRRSWAMPFVWIGSNAITLYLANNIIDFSRLARRFAGGDVKQFFDTALAQGAGDLAICAVALAFAFVLAHFLYRRKIFLRL